MADTDPDLPARLAKAVADLYGDAAAQLLELIARRLAAGVTEPGWAEQKLSEISRLRDDARKVVDRLTDTGPDEVRAVIDAAAAAGRQAAVGDLPGSVTGSLTPVTNTPAVDALARETVAAVTGTHLQILRNVNDVYRSVIAETAAPGVVTGSVTTLQAAQRALDRFADRGITGFVDTAGRRWELESYVEMATRTASGRAQIQGRLDVYQADGRDIVIVSNSPEECPLCRPFEGRLLSISGASVGRTIDGRRVIDSVSGATSKGLFHANCTHDTRPYIVGLTKPMTGTGNPDGYEARQEQRRLERQVRQWKRREAVAMDDQTAKAARAKVRAWQKRLKEHVDSHDLFRQPERERLRMPRGGGGPGGSSPGRGRGSGGSGGTSGGRGPGGPAGGGEDDQVRRVHAMMAEQTATATGTERAAVRAWQSTDRYYQQVQQAVRDPRRPISRQVEATMEGLDSLIGRGPGLTEDVTVWRGIRSLTNTLRVPAASADQLVGSELPLPGYLATSVRRSIAEQFRAPPGPGGSVLLQLTVPSGTPAAWVPPLGRTDLADQAELLFDAHRRIMVESVHHADGTTIIVGRIV